MMAGVSAASTVRAIQRLGFTHVVIIPDGETRHLYWALTGESGVPVISPTREGEGVAIAAGLWVGGQKPLVVLQNTGLMEAGDAIRGCGLGPRIPLRLMVGWRGYPGVIAGHQPIDSAYPYTEPVLQAWGIPYRLLMGDDDLDALEEMDRTAAKTSLPAAVLFGWAFRP